MRFHKTDEPDTLQGRRSTARPQLVFALVLFGLAVLALLPALGVTQAQAPPLAGLLISALLAAAGVTVLTYRSGFTLNQRGGVLTRWWSVLGLRWHRDVLLDQLERVVLSRERRDTPRPNRTYVVYPVRLEGDVSPVTLDESMDERAARATARHVAEVLGLAMEDRT